MIQQGTALEHNALSIQCRSYPRAEVCEVTNASGRPVPTHLAEKYRLFTLDPTGTALVLANRIIDEALHAHSLALSHDLVQIASCHFLSLTLAYHALAQSLKIKKKKYLTFRDGIQKHQF